MFAARHTWRTGKIRRRSTSTFTLILTTPGVPSAAFTSMRIERVEQYPSQSPWHQLRVTCMNCSKKLIGGLDSIYADLDGEPFRAYLCTTCKIEESSNE